MKFSCEMVLGAPLVAVTSGRNSVSTSSVALEKAAGQKIVRPSIIDGSSMPLGVLSVTMICRSCGSATAFVRRSAIRSNTPESLVFFIASRFSGKMASS